MTGTSTTFEMNTMWMLRTVSTNTFTDCQSEFELMDMNNYDTNKGVTVTIAPAAQKIPSGMDWFVVDGKNYKLLGQGSTNLTFDLVTGESLTVADGVTLKGTVSNGTTNSVSFGDAGVKAGEGGLTFAYGSVKISGTIDTSADVVITANGTVEIDGLEITEENAEEYGLTIGTGSDSSAVTIVGKLTVSEGAKLTIADGATLTVDKKATLAVEGTVTYSEDSGTGKIVNNGTIAITNTKASIPAKIEGTGTVDTSAVASEGVLGGKYDTTTTFTQNQTITAVEDIILVKGTIFTFEGKFIIPEGITVTIEDGAQLIIKNSTGKLENSGTIIVESDVKSTEFTPESYAGGLVLDGGEIKNSGTIILDYSNDLDTNPWNTVMRLKSGKVINDGTISVGDESKFSIDTGVTMVNNGTFQMEGMFSQIGEIDTPQAVIENSGTIVFDGETETDVTVVSASADAVIQVIEFKASETDDKKLIVSDKNVLSTAKDYQTGKYNKDESKVEIFVGPKDAVSGITIAVETKKVMADNGTDYTIYKNMAVSGVVTASTTEVVTGGATATVTAKITMTGDNIVSGDLSLGENVDLEIGAAEKDTLLVSGTITGAKEADITVGTNGSITVDGKITLVKKITGNVNAASYEIAATTTTSKQFVYTTLATAVADGAKKIEMLGSSKISEDVTVPSGVTVEFDTDARMTIGKDAKVSFDEGSVLRNKTTDVDGVLYIADVKGTLKTTGTITSDVIIDGEKDRTYCGVAYALANANDGDTVKLSDKNTTAVIIDKSLVIPAGVTLDTNKINVELKKNIVLTVDGTLFINESTLTHYSETIGNADKLGKVVVNGVVKSTDEINAALKITGAYYVIDNAVADMFYVEPVENAVSKIAEAGQIDVIKGIAANMIVKNYEDSALKVSDITVTGKSTDEPAVIVFTEGDIEIKSITLKDSKAYFDLIHVDAVISGADGTITIDGESTTFYAENTIVDDEQTFIFGGTFTYDANEKAGYKFTVAGTASVSKSEIYKIVVDGTLNVAKTTASELADITNLVVNGTFDVPSDEYVDIEQAEVFGTFTVAELTTEQQKGNATVGKLYAGVSAKNVYTTLGATASITGPVSVTNYAIVAADSTVPESVTKDQKFTEFYVEGALYVTAYDFNGGLAINNIKASVPNTAFTQWNNDKGNEVLDSAKIGDYEKVTALIDYEIYGVRIVACDGIGSITIDGNIYDPVYSADGYVTYLKAGTHKIEYTVLNGYSGSATLAVNGSAVDGATCTISGMSFTISGDFDKKTPVVTLQLTGLEKSGYVPDAPDTDDSGMGITDYLLIILVVLIVVMAIIVAMRLMRS